MVSFLLIGGRRKHMRNHDEMPKSRVLSFLPKKLPSTLQRMSAPHRMKRSQ